MSAPAPHEIPLSRMQLSAYFAAASSAATSETTALDAGELVLLGTRGFSPPYEVPQISFFVFPV